MNQRIDDFLDSDKGVISGSKKIKVWLIDCCIDLNYIYFVLFDCCDNSNVKTDKE